MKIAPLKALFWKEWLEARWGLYVGLILFLAMPIIETVTKLQYVSSSWIEKHGQYQSSMQSELLYVINFCGCIYALILAVAMVCHDMNDDATPESWRLVPVKSSTYITMKFSVGLMVLLSVWLLVICIDALVVISVEMIGSSSFASAFMYWLNRMGMGIIYLALTVSVYALSFMFSVWHRRAISSAILSGVGALLLCFLPLLAPVLESFNIWKIAQYPMFTILDKSYSLPMHVAENLPYNMVKIMDRLVIINKAQWWFFAFAAVLMFASIIIIRQVVHRQWQLKLNAKQMAWFFVIVGMGLFSLAAQQVGNNLEPEQIIPLNQHMTVTNITMAGDRGMALTRDSSGYEAMEKVSRQLRSIDLKNETPLSMNSMKTGQHSFAYPDTLQRIAWSPEHSDIAYMIHADMYNRQSQWRYSRVMLMTVQFNSQDKAQRLNFQDIPKTFYDPSYEYDMPGVYLQDKTLWLYHYKYDRKPIMNLLRYDLSDPQTPRLLDTYQFKSNWYQIGSPFERNGKKLCKIDWPEVKGISDTQMWQLIEHLRINLRPYHVTPNHIVEYDEKIGLLVYLRNHLAEPLKNGKPNIEYQLATQVNLSPLAKLIDAGTVTWLWDDGFLYVLIHSHQSGMIVYDHRDIEHVKQVGYYYAPGEQLSSLTSLGDGRIAAAGHKLHIFNPKNW